MPVTTVVTSMAVAVVLAVVLPLPVLCVISYIYYRCQRYTYRHLPGPKPRWPLGNASMLQTPSGAKRRLSELHLELHKQYGNVCVFFMGSTAIVLISGMQSHHARSGMTVYSCALQRGHLHCYF
jgi:hypothetical protein